MSSNLLAVMHHHHDIVDRDFMVDCDLANCGAGRVQPGAWGPPCHQRVLIIDRFGRAVIGYRQDLFGGCRM